MMQTLVLFKQNWQMRWGGCVEKVSSKHGADLMQIGMHLSGIRCLGARKVPDTLLFRILRSGKWPTVYRLKRAGLCLAKRGNDLWQAFSNDGQQNR
jgi:hypothetical protein